LNTQTSIAHAEPRLIFARPSGARMPMRSSRVACSFALHTPATQRVAVAQMTRQHNDADGSAVALADPARLLMFARVESRHDEATRSMADKVHDFHGSILPLLWAHK
jgi:hypothetical protein